MVSNPHQASVLHSLDTLDIKKNHLNPAREAWEHFVKTGEFLQRSPRAVICQSWMKSWEQGINPHQERATTVLTLEEIESKLRGEQLGQASVPLMQNLVRTFAGSKHVMVLANSEGHILHSVGHREIQYHLDKINFMPGGHWAADEVGPNGVGTPLQLGKPEAILGPEHFCQAWQPWVCYGAPIFDANGEKLLGVIDITGPIEKASHETMLLTISVAQSIQQSIVVLNYHRREKLRALARDVSKRWQSDALMLIDEDGYILDYNASINRYFDDRAQGLIGMPLTTLLPGIWELVHTRIFKKSYGQIDIDIRNDIGINRPVQIHIEPIVSDGEPLGAILIITGNTAAKKNQPEQKPEPRTKYTFDNILGSSDTLRKTITLARAAALDPLENNVLLVGETGTGKELIAHSIHAESSRSSGPFVTVNCGAIPHELIESELFGYVAGAFTGARREGKPGKFESAQGGTLFLDEIDSLDIGMQAKFLRVLDQNEINRLGSNQVTPINVRIISAAGRDVYPGIEEGKFRLDLYHRLGVIEIPIPPLRQRDGDVIELANIFLEKECRFANRPPLKLSKETRAIMLSYNWPGNVRELYNLCLRWVLTVNQNCIGPDCLQDKIRFYQNKELSTLGLVGKKDLQAINDELITRTLESTGGNVSKAAEILGINRATIYRRMKNRRQHD